MMNDLDETGSRILIVDDNPRNLQVLGKFLQNEQYELEFAINGSVALEWLEIKEFDLVLLDINMPGIDGFEVCRIIRANPKFDKMPVFFLTAETLRDSVLKGFDLGAQDYITKPFDSRELIMRVRTHISLKKNMEKLEQLNQTLEQKVADRTRELNNAKEKAEESDRLKTAFLMNISHEIRTPLNGILGSLKLLEKDDLDKEKKKEWIDLAYASGYHLLDTLSDIIEISCIQAGESEISWAEVNTMDVMQQLHSVFKRKADALGLEFKITEMVVGLPAIVLSDVKMINRIFDILMKNAIKFTASGSIELGSYMDDDSLVFFVKDTGCGIPAGLNTMIFKRFVQADMRLSRMFEGMGLGLSIAKAYAEALNGKIWVQSEPDKGSTFFFSVPCKR